MLVLNSRLVRNISFRYLEIFIALCVALIMEAFRVFFICFLFGSLIATWVGVVLTLFIRVCTLGPSV